MILNGKINRIAGNKVIVELNDLPDLRKVSKLSNGKQPSVEIDLEDGRTITPAQRAKAWALMNDICDWSGYMPLEIEQIMKVRYMIHTNTEYFSMHDCSVETATGFIESIINFCFNNDIPFKTKTWDLIKNSYPIMIQCLRHRRCCICGKPADIAHYETVGMGRNRRHIDHSEYHFMALCRKHHEEQHTIGLLTFCRKYQLKPIKLSDDDRKSLRIGG